MNTFDYIKNHPAFQGMDQQKLDFILEFATKEKPSSMKEALPFLMASMAQAKKQQINFSNPEIALITELLTRDLPAEEQKRVRKILSMLDSGNSPERNR